jgi:signal peptidase
MAIKKFNPPAGGQKSKIFNILTALVQVILILILVILSVLSFGTRLPYFSRLGINFFAVTSGSMEPTLPLGSLIYAGKYKLDELKEGDIITFKVKDPESGNVSVVTHRIEKAIKDEIIKKPAEGEEGKEKKILKYEFVTKGDANNASDIRTVPSANIIGLYQWYIPKIGYLTSFTQTGRGFLLLVILPAIILIIWELATLIKNIKDYYNKKSQKEIEKLKKQLKAEKEKTKKKKKAKKKKK